MPLLRYTLDITLNGLGTEIPILYTTASYDLYIIKGSAVATGNYSLSPTGIPLKGMTYNFQYRALLDITTNTKTFSLFGYNLTQTQLTKNWEATCYYNGASWEVTLKLDFSESDIIENYQLGDQIIQSNNIAANTITSTNIANGSITLNKLASDSVDSSKIVDGTIQAIDLGTDCVTTSKILDSNVTTNKVNDLAITTNKLANQSVTTTKIANSAITNTQLDNLSVDTNNIIDNSVTNAKLATGTPSSVKICNNLGDVQDLILGLDELPIGNGTDITVIPLNNIIQGIGQRDFETLNISFELNEQAPNRVYLPKCYIEQILFQVTKPIEPTDDAFVNVSVNGTPTVPPNITYSAGSPIPSTNTLIFATHPVISNPSGGWIELSTSKVTPGGKLIVSISYVRQ